VPQILDVMEITCFYFEVVQIWSMTCNINWNAGQPHMWRD